MTDEKAAKLLGSIKDLVEKQDEARETLKKLVLSIEYERIKGVGEHVSVEMWAKRKVEVLHRAGLGPAWKPAMRWTIWS